MNTDNQFELENKKLREVLKLREDLNSLHLQMMSKVNNHDFENAAKLRDEKKPIIERIISLEKELGIT